jgi:hypothetical protein
MWINNLMPQGWTIVPPDTVDNAQTDSEQSELRQGAQSTQMKRRAAITASGQR